VALHQEHNESVDFIEGVEYGEQVAWVAVRGDGEDVTDRGREKSSELLLRKHLE
jgi:hypothetical protein